MRGKIQLWELIPEDIDSNHIHAQAVQTDQEQKNHPNELAISPAQALFLLGFSLSCCLLARPLIKLSSVILPFLLSFSVWNDHGQKTQNPHTPAFNR